MAEKVRKFIPIIPIGEIGIHWIPEREGMARGDELDEIVKEINDFRKEGFELVAFPFEPVDINSKYQRNMMGSSRAYPVIIKRKK